MFRAILTSNDQRVVGSGRSDATAAAAAADAGEHLPVGAPVTAADRGVDEPREREVGRADRAARQRHVVDDDRAVAGRVQQPADHVRTPQHDERSDDRRRQVDRLELAMSRLYLLPLLLLLLLRQLRGGGTALHSRLRG